MNAHDLAAHLRFYQELGVSGISRDASWRRREGLAGAPEPATDPESLIAAPPAAREPLSGSPMALTGLRPTDGLVGPLGSPAPSERDPFGHDVGGSERLVRSAAEVLAGIRTDIGECTRCKLHALGRRQIVFGTGNPGATLMFVGEAPGADEDIQGAPFVGRAGQLLTKIIEAIGLTRSDVYIANVIKCRPPDNRNPEPDEVATCEPFLFQQVDAIAPRVIVALGTFAARTLLKTTEPISRLRGQVFDYRGAKLVPTFHPAFLLRSPDRKRDVWEDMKRVRELLLDPPHGG